MTRSAPIARINHHAQGAPGERSRAPDYERLDLGGKSGEGAAAFPDLTSQEELDLEAMQTELGLRGRFTVEDLEWSDWGRSPRFRPGWWIGPAVLLAQVIGVLVMVWWVWR